MGIQSVGNVHSLSSNNRSVRFAENESLRQHSPQILLLWKYYGKRKFRRKKENQKKDQGATWSKELREKKDTMSKLMITGTKKVGMTGTRETVILLVSGTTPLEMATSMKGIS